MHFVPITRTNDSRTRSNPKLISVKNEDLRSKDQLSQGYTEATGLMKLRKMSPDQPSVKNYNQNYKIDL